MKRSISFEKQNLLTYIRISTEFENEWKETILKRHGIRECCVKISRLTPKGIPNVQLNPCDGETEDVMSIENETRKGLYSTPSVGSVRSHVPWLPIKPTLNSSSFLFRGNK